MVSENIVRQLDGQLNTRFVDEVYASNMNKRIKVFEVYNRSPASEGDRLFQYTKNYQLAFVKYQLGRKKRWPVLKNYKLSFQMIRYAKYLAQGFENCMKRH